MRFEVDAECRKCGGTGLYIGIAERDGAAVVCHTCDGSGCEHIAVEYEPFRGRIDRDGVEWVYECNPETFIGNGNGHEFRDYGGMPIADWKSGREFGPGLEDRGHICPAWWYQSTNYKLKPDWKECSSSWGSTFSKCNNFKQKHKCWERWDDDQRLTP